MAKPPLYIDLISGDSYQFAIGREDTLKIQNVEALSPTLASALFAGSSGQVSLGGAATSDLVFGARGSSITLNQAGDEALDPGFTATSIIGALNQLLSGGGSGSLQQAYNIGNQIVMTPSRSLLFQTDVANTSDFLVRNAAGITYLRSNAATTSVSIGDTLINDIYFNARGGSLTFNQAGNTALVGFALATTSIVAALNELKATPGATTLQGAYNGGNTITMTTGRNVDFSTFDGAGPSNFLVHNQTGFKFLQTDTVNSELKLGDGSNVFVNFPGLVDSGVWFDPTLAKMMHVGSRYSYDIGILGAVTPDFPVSLHLIGRRNSANTAGADLWLTAERNTVGTEYGGTIGLNVYDGNFETGTWRGNVTVLADSGGTGKSMVWAAARTGTVLIQSYASPPETNNPGITIWAEDAPLLLYHEGNAIWRIGSGGGTTTFTDSYNRIYAYFDGYTSGGRVGVGSNAWPGAGNGQFFRNLIGTITNVATIVDYQADAVLLANVRTGGPDYAGLCVWNSDPNGTCKAPAGSLLLRTDTPSVYVNTDGVSAWTALGSGGGSASTLIATYTTAEAVTAGDVLYMLAAGTVGIADYTTANVKDTVVGIATQTVGSGAACIVALAGETTVKTAIAAGDKGKEAFLNATGNVSTTAPSSGGLTLVRLGVVTVSGGGAGTCKVSIQIGTPVLL